MSIEWNQINSASSITTTAYIVFWTEQEMENRLYLHKLVLLLKFLLVLSQLLQCIA